MYWGMQRMQRGNINSWGSRPWNVPASLVTTPFSLLESHSWSIIAIAGWETNGRWQDNWVSRQDLCFGGKLLSFWNITDLLFNPQLNTCLISCRCSNLVYHSSNLTFMKVFGKPALCEHSQILIFFRLVSCICSWYDTLYRCFTDSLLIISGRFNFSQIYHYGIIDATKHQCQVVDKYEHLEEFIL